jgi:hypothetical protein
MEVDDIWDDDEDRVTFVGEKADGSRDVLGTVPKPPAMKRREIVRDFFGEPGGPDDMGEPSSCLCALEQYHDWLLRQGWTAPQLTVTPSA